LGRGSICRWGVGRGIKGLWEMGVENGEIETGIGVAYLTAFGIGVFAMWLQRGAGRCGGGRTFIR